ncbi:ATP-binding protein [Tissierella praeacuta]|uniref:ATP-binding protein n=1 Tax=Tissierella praeacuta TaxID=43131 RepID=UPI003A520E67
MRFKPSNHWRTGISHNNKRRSKPIFQLISAPHEQASLIITSNKGLEDWTELLGDPALTMAVLDKLPIDVNFLI